MSTEGVTVLALSDSSLPQEPVNLACDILLLPLDIAIYRLLILGETGLVIAWIRSTIASSDCSSDSQLVGIHWSSSLCCAFDNAIRSMEHNCVCRNVACVHSISLRMIVLFPAIAVDASGRRWAMPLPTRGGKCGSFSKDFFVSLPAVLAICVGVLGELLLWLITHDTSTSDWSISSSDWPAAFQIIFFGFLHFLTQVAAAAMLSRLFGWIGSKVKGRDFPTALPQGA